MNKAVRMWLKAILQANQQFEICKQDVLNYIRERAYDRDYYKLVEQCEIDRLPYMITSKLALEILNHPSYKSMVKIHDEMRSLPLPLRG